MGPSASAHPVASAMEDGQDSAYPPLLILNPASAHGSSRALRQLLRSLQRTFRVELVETAHAGHATNLAQEAAGSGRPVVAIGGDGTISEAAAGILAASRPVPLGIVPAGNGNDYAYGTLGLPHDIRKALAIALNGSPRAVDVGYVNDRVFVNAMGVGIDANIAAAAEAMKGVPLLRGHLLYMAASLRELLLHYDLCPSLRVTFGQEVTEEYPPSATPSDRADDRPLTATYALAAVTLGATYGGGFHISPGADPSDGAFDVCLVDKPRLLRALQLLRRIERGNHYDEPEVHHFHARTLTLHADTPLYAHVDGEVLLQARFHVRLQPAALLVRYPYRGVPSIAPRRLG